MYLKFQSYFIPHKVEEDNQLKKKRGERWSLFCMLKFKNKIKVDNFYFILLFIFKWDINYTFAHEKPVQKKKKLN